MDIKRYETGNRMSQVAVHNQTAYLAGQVGNASSNVADQTREALARIDFLLESVGSNRENLLQVVIWLADMADFETMNSIWDAWVPLSQAPSRACGQVRLATPELKVEIIVIAAIKAH